MKTKKEKLYETDLYKPISKYFTKNGYVVNGEVHHCDITAVKDEELIIIELKLNLTVDLLVQATKRQRLTNQVYIAIPKPKYRITSKKWQDICYLIRRLELGLIVVSFNGAGAKMEIMISPGPFNRDKSMKLNKKKRANILNEISGRNGDYNVGGSNKTKIMTSYKESCIHIATLFERYGPLSPKSLRGMGTGDKTLSILNKNYYGWFEKISRGTYNISDKGKIELKQFPQQIKYFEELNLVKYPENERDKMTIYIALLRGINVGGHNIIKMADLKNLFEKMGLANVKTYIQSGNVLFESDEEASSIQEKIEAEILADFGFKVPVVLRTAQQLEEIISSCPFPTDSFVEGESLQLSFMAEAPSQEAVTKLQSVESASDEFKIEGENLYLFLRQSIRHSKLAIQIQKLGVPATVRNWKTVIKLASMAKAMRG